MLSASAITSCFCVAVRAPSNGFEGQASLAPKRPLNGHSARPLRDHYSNFKMCWRLATVRTVIRPPQLAISLSVRLRYNSRVFLVVGWEMQRSNAAEIL